MHQTHNIAWDSLSSNLAFVFENKAVTPWRTDFFPRSLPSQARSLNHFAKTVATTIQKFSDTERAKYPAHYSAPSSGPIFSTSLLSRYCDLPFPSVTAKNQLLENWIERAGPTTPWYSTSHGDLADVVKVLLAENEMDQLLMLAQHPRVPLADLHSLSWGHSFGWDHIMDWALRPYLFFNILLSKPELIADGRYKSMISYTHAIRFATGSGDYDAQAFPHREFFFGATDTWLAADAVDPLGDADKLHEYLKMCFRMLYRYDMLARECGRYLDWEGTVARTVNSMWNADVDYIEDERAQWITRFV
ncbi:hypothetical protein B0H17DRAFT_981469 [Mycena rosella]|uniref:Uncharacterized protein n=1 Tax=Mycena rosella TaxID=1033263 RepID=A0AAD7GJE9_MYCRO|nr:hypothetical protein B0H17DRAFT_981469 [Mycena rosella]